MYRKIQILIVVHLSILSIFTPQLFCQDTDVYTTSSQNNKVMIPQSLMSRGSVNFENVSFEEALKIVSEKSNVPIKYDEIQISNNTNIYLKEENELLFNILIHLTEMTGTEPVISGKDEITIRSSSGNISDQDNRITGRVLDKDTQRPLIGANILVVGTGKGGLTDLDGNFMITHLTPGIYSLRFSYLGYKTVQIDDIILFNTKKVEINVQLDLDVISLKEIVVTPSQFTIMGEVPPSRQTLTHDDIQIMAWGEDTYRAIARLPGISSSDFSAKFTVRGGEHDQVLVLLDGMELYEPFHLKDIEGGALSIVDVEGIEGIDLLTGGFTAEYGDRMSGVFNMKSKRAPQGYRRTSLGLSLMNARAMYEGTFKNNRGSWLLSARRGYLDIVLDLMGEDESPSPKYYDLLGRMEYSLNDKHTLSANLLQAGDKLSFTEDDDDVNDTGYDNTNAWLTLRSVPNQNLFVRTIASYSRLTNRRDGIAYRGEGPALDFNVSDERFFDVYGIGQDWNLDISDRLAMKWGMNLKRSNANYDYHSIRYLYLDASADSEVVTNVNIQPSGNRISAYLAPRIKIISPLTVELGLRYDQTTYTDDRKISPRFNIVYALGKETYLRGGWGYFYQSQGIHQIRVEDGEDRFFPASLAKHWVAAFEHLFNNGLHLRLEGYYKNLSDLRSDYRNWTNEIELFPELQDDRFKLNIKSAHAKGIEIYLKYDRGGKWTWWASYALAEVVDDIENLQFEGIEYTEDAGEYPGKYDQRHTIYFDLNFRPNRHWHFNLSWQYHTGWPYTQRILKSEKQPDGSTYYYETIDEFHGAYYPAYHRLDFKINRHFYTSKGRISAFLTLINLYDHGNVRNIAYNWYWNSGKGYFPVEEPEYWFRLLPSIGINWTWEH